MEKTKWLKIEMSIKYQSEVAREIGNQFIDALAAKLHYFVHKDQWIDGDFYKDKYAIFIPGIDGTITAYNNILDAIEKLGFQQSPVKLLLSLAIYEKRVGDRALVKIQTQDSACFVSEAEFEVLPTKATIKVEIMKTLSDFFQGPLYGIGFSRENDTMKGNITYEVYSLSKDVVDHSAGNDTLEGMLLWISANIGRKPGCSPIIYLCSDIIKDIIDHRELHKGGNPAASFESIRFDETKSLYIRAYVNNENYMPG